MSGERLHDVIGAWAPGLSPIYLVMKRAALTVRAPSVFIPWSSSLCVVIRGGRGGCGPEYDCPQHQKVDALYIYFWRSRMMLFGGIARASMVRGRALVSTENCLQGAFFLS